jgi:hypothetical protein
MNRFVMAAAVVLLSSSAWAQTPDAGTTAVVSPDAGTVGMTLSIGTQSKETFDLDDELPVDVAKRLSPEQLTALLLARGKPHHSLTGVLVPFFPFATAAFILAAVLYYRHRQNALRQETLRLMIEKGREIPAELLSPPTPRRSDLRRGVVLIGLGAGVAAFLLLHEVPNRGLWGIGLIPVLMGAGYLLAWRLESNNDKPSN